MEPVGAVVGDGHRVVVAVVGDEGHHRPEDLLPGHRHVVAGARRSTVGRTKKPRSRPVGAADPPATSVAPSPTPASMAARTRARWACGDDRSHGGGAVEGVAEDVGPGHVGGQGRRLVVEVAGDDHPAPRHARLARVHEALADARPHRLLEVGVVEDDVGRLPSELEHHPLEVARGQGRHPAAGGRRAGERHQVDPRVGDQRLPHPTPAGDDVEHARRQSHLVGRVGQDEGGEGGQLRRLEDDGAAGGEGGRHLLHRLEEGVVPRGDGGDHADRLPHDQREPDLLLEREGAGHVGVGRHDHQRAADLNQRGEGERAADLLRHQQPDLRQAGDEEVVHPLDELGPVVDRGRGPPVEGGAGGGHGPVDVGRRPVGDVAERLLGGRVDKLDGGRSRRAHPVAAEEEVVARPHVEDGIERVRRSGPPRPASGELVTLRPARTGTNVTSSWAERVRSGASGRRTWSGRRPCGGRGASRPWGRRRPPGARP